MRIDLGCGPFKKPGFVGIDIFDWSDKYAKDEFLQGEIPEVLHNFKENSIEEVRASHFIEHIPQAKVIEFMNEVHRILTPGGVFEINVPPSTGRGAFCDPTHVSFWNDMSFRYYDKTWSPDLTGSYGITADFHTLKMELLSEFDLHVILKKRC
jgi:ubiquinone/menaquinone biosynthesis C-methylase UbiE